MNALNGNSMRRFAFFIAQVILARRIRAERALATSSTFTGTCGGCDHATGQASFEAETHNQSRRRDDAGRRRTESFADGQRVRIYDAHPLLISHNLTVPRPIIASFLA